MRDGNHNGWEYNGLLLSGTRLLSTGSNGTAHYGLDSTMPSVQTVQLCNLQELKVARKTGGYDTIESSFSLSKGGETFEWSNYLEVDTVLFRACLEGQSWTGTECAPCGAGFVSSVGICKPQCPQGYAYEDNQCTCDDKYTLIMEDTAGNGWYVLRLQTVTADGVGRLNWIPFTRGLTTEKEQKVDLCGLTTLFVSRTPDEYDIWQSEFTLKKGDDTIHAWGKDGELWSCISGQNLCVYVICIHTYINICI